MVVFGCSLAISYLLHGLLTYTGSLIISGAAFILAILISSATKIADPWDKALVLRLGNFHSLKGPGLFFIIPILDTITYWIDTLLITTSFKAEKTLTKDTVPVDVDAVLFFEHAL